MERISGKRRGGIEILFPIVLFLVFAISAISVILFAARIYKNEVETAQSHYATRISLEYLTEKLHRSDAAGGVRVSSYEGNDALVLTDSTAGDDYRTYIYCYGGWLRELYVRGEISVDPETGSRIIALESLQAEDAGNHLLRLTCTDSSGQSQCALVAIRSEL